MSMTGQVVYSEPEVVVVNESTTMYPITITNNGTNNIFLILSGDYDTANEDNTNLTNLGRILKKYQVHYKNNISSTVKETYYDESDTPTDPYANPMVSIFEEIAPIQNIQG